MQKIADNVWKLNVDSNIYYLEEEKIIIDAGPRSHHEHVKKELSSKVELSKIKKVIFTHLHLDHIGNFDLFPNAEYYASPEEIAYFKKNPVYAILDAKLAQIFDVELKPLTQIKDFEIIKCPGHTHGSIALLYKKKILFSGDTIFRNGIGRTDFPCSLPDKMEETLENIQKVEYEILAPGHDY